MKKFTIKPADAADDMERNYRRELRRHRKQMQERVRAGVIGALVLGVIAIGVTFALQRADQKELPKTQFEAAAEAKAKAAAGKKLTAKAPAKTVAHTSSDEKVASSSTRKSSASAKSAKKTPGSSTKTAAKPAPAKRTGRMVAAASLPKRTISVAVTSDGFNPAKLEVPFGARVLLSVKPASDADLAGFRIPQLDLEGDNTTKTVTIDLGSPGKGSYSYTTYKGTISGTLVVK